MLDRNSPCEIAFRFYYSLIGLFLVFLPSLGIEDFKFYVIQLFLFEKHYKKNKEQINPYM